MIINYEKRHLNTFFPNESLLQNEFMIDDFLEVFNLQAINNNFSSLIVEDKVIIIGGFIKMFDGVYSALFLNSIYINKYKKSVFKTVKNFINEILEKDKVHRIQTVTYEQKKYCNFLSRLGFTKECVMKKFMWNENDFSMWSIVK